MLPIIHPRFPSGISDDQDTVEQGTSIKTYYPGWLPVVAEQACFSNPAAHDQSNYHFSPEGAALSVGHHQPYCQAPLYESDLKSSHPSAIVNPAYIDHHSVDLSTLTSQGTQSSWFYPSPIQDYPPPLTEQLHTEPLPREGLYFSQSTPETNDLVWDPAFDFLSNLPQFPIVPVSSHPPSFAQCIEGTEASPNVSSDAFPIPPQEWCATPSELFFPSPLPSAWNPISRSDSGRSPSSMLTEPPLLPAVYVSPPTPTECTSTAPYPPEQPSPSLTTPDNGLIGKFNYEDALREFKSAKRQRRIAVKSKTTASSGASIPLSPTPTEFTPIFSEQDQLWYCNVCGKGIKRHGDVIRHWRSYNCPVRKAALQGTKKRLACPFPSCKYSTGRRDGLSRHLNVHRPTEEQ